MSDKVTKKEIEKYCTCSAKDKNIYKIDKYWLEKIIIAPNKQKLKPDTRKTFNILGIDKIAEQLEILANEELFTKEQLLDLYCEKQENSKKIIQIFQINSDKIHVLQNLKNKIINKFGTDKFDKHKLVDSIIFKPTSSSSKLKLLYINEINQNCYNLVYNYRLTWFDVENQQVVEKTDYASATVQIDALNKIFQIRITKHPAFGKKQKNPENLKNGKPMDDIIDVLKNEIYVLLNIKEEDTLQYSIRNNVKKLFSNDILTKYEGIHKHKENNTDVEVHFTIPIKTAKVDYTDLNIYKKLQDLHLDNAILLIKGTWNLEKEEIKNNFIQPEKIVFDIRKNEIQTLSSYTKKELDYALSHIIKNI